MKSWRVAGLVVVVSLSGLHGCKSSKRDDAACTAKMEQLEAWWKAVLAEPCPPISFGLDKNTRLVRVDDPPRALPDAPEVRVAGTLMLLDGTPVGSTRPMEDSGRLLKIEELTDGLARRPKSSTALLVLDREAPWVVVAAIVHNLAWAGLPSVTFVFQTEYQSNVSPPPKNWMSEHYQRLNGPFDPAKGVPEVSDVWSRVFEKCSAEAAPPKFGGGEMIGTDGYSRVVGRHVLDRTRACSCQVDFDVVRAGLWGEARRYDTSPFLWTLEVQVAQNGSGVEVISAGAKTPWSQMVPKLREAAKRAQPAQFNVVGP